MNISDTDRLLACLQRVWTYGFTTKSDYAREFADELAQGSSAGLMTTQVAPGDLNLQDRPVFGRVWKVTPKGLTHLFDNFERIAQDEINQYIDGYVNPDPACPECGNRGGHEFHCSHRPEYTA